METIMAYIHNIIEYLDSIFINKFAGSSITILTTLVILTIINRFLNKIIKKRWADSYVVPMRTKRIILWTIAIATIFSQIIPLQSLSKTLLASGGIFAVVIGLASQEAASSMINGMMIFTYKPYSVNDMISIPERNVRGKVVDITLRHTVLETIEKTQLIIPNTIMNQNMIENISNIPDKKANYLWFDISYDSDMNQAITILQSLASNHSDCIDIRTSDEKQQGLPLVPVYCMEFKDSGISMRATVYSKDNATGFEMLSDLRKQLLLAFEKEGIIIPYPHTVIVSDTKK